MYISLEENHWTKRYKKLLENSDDLAAEQLHFLFLFLQQQELSSKVFAHLCEVVDDNKQFYDEKIHQISKLIILEGKSWQNRQTFICVTSISYSLHRFTSHQVNFVVIVIGFNSFL